MNKEQKKLIKDMYKKAAVYDQLFSFAKDNYDYCEFSFENRKSSGISTIVGKMQQISLMWK
jgi:hypothetical protein